MTGQLPFDFAAATSARAVPPAPTRPQRTRETSRESYRRTAADSATTRLRRRVLALLRTRPMADCELAEVLSLSEATVRPRRWELCQAGLVTKSDQQVQRAGRRRIRWMAVSSCG